MIIRMMMISDNLKKLNTTDIYSMLLFAVFNIQKIPGYAVLSELVYILDKNNLLKLCEYFGGQTITIPTIDELEILIYCLVIYNDVVIEKRDFDKVIKSLPVESYLLKQIKEKYFELKEVLDTYEFIPRKT